MCIGHGLLPLERSDHWHFSCKDAVRKRVTSQPLWDQAASQRLSGMYKSHVFPCRLCLDPGVSSCSMTVLWLFVNYNLHFHSSDRMGVNATDSVWNAHFCVVSQESQSTPKEVEVLYQSVHSWAGISMGLVGAENNLTFTFWLTEE